MDLFFLADIPSTPQEQHLVLLCVSICVALLAIALAAMALRRSAVQKSRAARLTASLSRAATAAQRRMHFLNAISHDLRTPLNGIVLQTHIIEQRLDRGDREGLRAALADIRRASDGAADVLDALLKYAQTDDEQNHVAEFCLKQLLSEVVDPFRAAAEEKQLGFSMTLPETVPIRSDRTKLQRVLVNLIDNAVKFTTFGAISVRVVKGRDEVEIDISDTGPGISDEHLRKMFEEFYQVNNPSRDPRQGLGLGLAVAHRLSEQLGGTLDAQSEPGRGTTFRVRLPQELAA